MGIAYNEITKSGRKWENMFFGNYNHNLDAKGRMVVPSKFRNQVGENAKVYIIEGFEGCLSIYPEQHFQKLMDKLQSYEYTSQNDRQYVRNIFASIVELEVDAHNRISLPKATLEYYKIDNDVTIVGVGDHFEIWNRLAFEENRQSTSKNLGTIADRLGGRRE